MAISDRIEAIEQHLEDDYSVLEVAGADLTNIDKNIVNLKPTWQERLLYFMDNGTEEVWNNWNKATGEGTSIILNNTLEAKMKIELKGNTYQDGTPTPDTPQEVQTVTGDNTIKVANKNLLNFQNGTYTTTTGITAIVENGKITLNGTATANSFLTIPFVYEYNGTYTISANNEETIGSTTASGTYASVRINGNTDTQAIMGSKNATRTFTINQKYNDFTVRTGSGLTYNDFVIYPQLEIGSQATSFEPYKSQTYEINLGNTELCKIGDYQDYIRKGTGKNLATNFSNLWYSGTNQNFYSATNFRSCSAKVSPNATYTISKKNASNRFVVIESQYPIDTTSTNHYIRVTIAEQNSNRTKYTFTTTSGTNYIFFGYYSGTTQSEIELAEQEIMIEIGQEQTSYEPYGYKDKWYIYKQIGKVVLDGSESWSRGSSATTRSVYALDTFTDRLSSNNRDDFYSDNFSYLGNAQLTDLGYAMSFNSGQYSNNIYIQVPLNVVAYDHVTDFKTWLSTHNTTVYYVLRTPTITEITDSELLSQLNALEGSRSYQGQTNINQENSNLASILNASALQEM